jgi:hypothetical protein
MGVFSEVRATPCNVTRDTASGSGFWAAKGAQASANSANTRPQRFKTAALLISNEGPGLVPRGDTLLRFLHENTRLRHSKFATHLGDTCWFPLIFPRQREKFHFLPAEPPELCLVYKQNAMRESRHSATAQRVAERRAAHQLFDQPRVFEDPLALSIIGAEATASLVSEPAKAQTHVSRALRAFIAVRSCYAEDNLAEAVRRGVTQYVVLGAGLDTFAYRNPFAELRVFEVNHPATQSWKRSRLEVAGIPIP